ncbi:MAG: hypothetical protein AAFZ49_15955, partial [Cyanobacteria bacterium J06659_2]
MTNTFKDFSAETDASQSMREFCDEYELRRATVIDWCKERDIPTDKGVGTDLKIQILREFKPEAVRHEHALAIIETTGMMRPTDIQVPHRAEVVVLDGLLAQYQIPQPHLNGTGQRLMEGVQMLALVVEGKQTMLNQRQQQINERFAALQKTQQLIVLIREKNSSLDAEIAATDGLAVQLAQQEAELIGELETLGVSQLPNPQAPN